MFCPAKPPPRLCAQLALKAQEAQEADLVRVLRGLLKLRHKDEARYFLFFFLVISSNIFLSLGLTIYIFFFCNDGLLKQIQG